MLGRRSQPTSAMGYGDRLKFRAEQRMKEKALNALIRNVNLSNYVAFRHQSLMLGGVFCIC